MFNFLKRLFGKPRPPKYLENNHYLLIETLKPIIKGNVLFVGKKLFLSEPSEEPLDQIVSIESGENPEALLEHLKPGGELLYIESAWAHPDWNGHRLKRKYANRATIHPIAIHWWLIHFRT